MLTLRTLFETLAGLYVLATNYHDREEACLFPSIVAAPPPHTQPRPYTIVVEGSVGCGKSTFLDFFRGYEGVMVVPEPVEEWQNVNGTDLLDLVLNNGKRWAGLFQMESTLTRLKAASQKPLDERGNAAGIRIMERSLYSERNCFLNLSRQSGIISDPEFSLMDRWFRFAVDKFRDRIQPDLIVYLRCDVDTLLERIKKRGRDEEANVSTEFLRSITRLHDDWLLHGAYPVPSKVLVLDGNLPHEDIEILVKRKSKQLFPGRLLPLRKY